MAQQNIEIFRNRPIKIALLGSSGSGKTLIRTALEGKNYNPNFFPSVGVEFSKAKLGLEITALPGGSRFRFNGFTQEILSQIVPNSDVAIICLDPSERDSYTEACYYAKQIRKSNSKASIIIALTQLDKNLPWKVSNEEIQRFKSYFAITEDTIGTSAALGETGIKELRAVLEATLRKIRGDMHVVKIPTLKEVLRKVDDFYQIAQTSLIELEQQSSEFFIHHHGKNELPPELEEPLKAVKELMAQLKKAKDIADNLRQVPETTKKEYIMGAYQLAVSCFIEKVNKDVLKVNPPQNIMNIILRLLRAPFIGFRMYSDDELKELQRFEQQTCLKVELQKMKSNDDSESAPFAAGPSMSE